MKLVKQAKGLLKKNALVYVVLDSTALFIKDMLDLVLSVLFSAFPINNNKIVINNYRGKGYGDNAKYIVEEILKLNKDYEIVWLLKDSTLSNHGIPKPIKIVSYKRWKAVYEFMTAKVWIDNSRLDFYLLKRNQQFYIQTWHGGLGLKKIEGDAAYGLKKRYITEAKRDSKKIDLMISNSKHLSDIYRRAFWYEGKILEAGYPKNDILFTDNAKYKDKVRHQLGLSKDIKILLYAPTFREGHSTNAYDIDFASLLASINAQEGDNWLAVARLHPNISNEIFSQTFPSYVINASEIADMQELVLGVDALVTDYSSCMFDSALAKIPTFIYASDIASYIDARGFYFSIDDLPFSVSKNTTELTNNILSFDKGEFLATTEDFYRKVGSYDQGDASKKVLAVIESIIGR